MPFTTAQNELEYTEAEKKLLETHAFVFPESLPEYDRAECTEVSFNIYPICEHGLRTNQLVWRIANQRDISDLRHFTGLNVIAVGIPMELHYFLRDVTWKQVSEGIIGFLKCLRKQFEEYGDISGILQMQSDVIESVWKRVIDDDEEVSERLQESVVPKLAELAIRQVVQIYHVPGVASERKHDLFMKMLWKDWMWIRQHLDRDDETRRQTMQICISGGIGSVKACVEEVVKQNGVFARIPEEVVCGEIVSRIIMRWADEIADKANGNSDMMVDMRLRDTTGM